MNRYHNRPPVGRTNGGVGNLAGAALIGLIAVISLIVGGLGWVAIPVGLIIIIACCMT